MINCTPFKKKQFVSFRLFLLDTFALPSTQQAEEGNRFSSEKATDKMEIESIDVTAAEVNYTSINMEDQPYSKADDHKEVKGTAISDDTEETTTQVVENQVSGISSFF